MTERIRSLSPEEINAIVARAREERAEFVAQLFKSAYAAIRGWIHRAPTAKTSQPSGPLAGAKA